MLGIFSDTMMTATRIDAFIVGQASTGDARFAQEIIDRTARTMNLFARARTMLRRLIGALF